jgi:hypothetical protein
LNTIRPATIDAVVFAWLKAEIESPRFGMRYDPYLTATLSERLIDKYDPSNETDNALRLNILSSARGAPIVTQLQQRQWSRVEFGRHELGELFYPSADWQYLSSSLLISEGVNSLQFPTPTILANSKFAADREVAFSVAKLYNRDWPMMEPIVIVTAGQSRVIEGCMRVNGYLLSSCATPLCAYLGTEGESL